MTIKLTYRLPFTLQHGS